MYICRQEKLDTVSTTLQLCPNQKILLGIGDIFTFIFSEKHEHIKVFNMKKKGSNQVYVIIHITKFLQSNTLSYSYILVTGITKVKYFQLQVLEIKQSSLKLQSVTVK